VTLEAVADAFDRFDVVVGSYPVHDGEPGRLKMAGTDPDAVVAAWVRERIDSLDE